MQHAEIKQWLSNSIPAELDFSDEPATAELSNGENLAVTTTFSQFDTGVAAVADGTDLRCELLTVARAPLADVASLTADVAHTLATAHGSIPAQPGSLVPNINGGHVMLIAPYLWGGPSPQLQEDGRLTLVLQLLWLTDAEYAYVAEEGIPAFQQAAAEEGIDLLDWQR